MTKRKKRLVI